MENYLFAKPNLARSIVLAQRTERVNISKMFLMVFNGLWKYFPVQKEIFLNTFFGLFHALLALHLLSLGISVLFEASPSELRTVP